MNRFLVFIVLLLLTACTSQTEVIPTATPITQAIVEQAVELPTATATPEPTNTFTPEPTATPTYTPTPTTTPTKMPTLTSSPTPDSGPEHLEIGRSVEDKPILAVRFGYGSYVIVLIGGLHGGFAPASVQIAERTSDYFTENLAVIPEDVTVYVIPNANPDTPFSPGNLAGRLNTNGVDLNRNWDCRWTRDARFRDEIIPGIGGSAPFSEPETQALRTFLEDVTPTAIVFWEAKYPDGLVSPGRCHGRSEMSFQLAERYGNAAQYHIDDFESDTGQILNGDGANWLDSQGFPAVAVMLPDYQNTDWDQNLQGVLAVMNAGQ